MTKFSIKVIDRERRNDYTDGDRDVYCLAEIQIGDFKETLWLSLSFWNIRNYETQWIEGLERIKFLDKSCLVTCVLNTLKKSSMELWILYKEKDKVFIQNIWLSDIDFEKFNKNTCYSYLHSREIYSSPGNKVDEWSVNLDDIVNFLEKIKKGKNKNFKKVSSSKKQNKKKAIKQDSMREKVRV